MVTVVSYRAVNRLLADSTYVENIRLVELMGGVNADDGGKVDGRHASLTIYHGADHLDVYIW